MHVTPADPEPSPSVADVPAGLPEPLRFTGSGSEYFGIWIVNLLLTLVTLGFYSPWAKVRRLQYFYRNVHLGDSSFEYTGRAGSILKGRLVALVLLGVVNVAPGVSPALGALAFLLLVGIFPWIVWKSFRFTLANSRYRGIRFGFDASVTEAYLVFLLLPLLSVISLGLLWPYAHCRIRGFRHARARFGQTGFRLETGPGRFYRIYLSVVAFLAGGATVVVGLLAGLRGAGAEAHAAALTLVGPLVLVGLLALSAFAETRLHNAIWNGTRLGQAPFTARLRAGRLLWIHGSNLVLTALTLGLFRPFAQVRALRYQVETLSVGLGGQLDAFQAAAAEQPSAAGEEILDLLDLDFAL